MSKLSQAIDYQFTGNKSYLEKPKNNYLGVSTAVQDIGYPKIGREFKIGVKLEAIKWVDDTKLIHSKENEPAIVSDVLNDLKRAMIEEVFGEFRPLIIEMRSALYDKDNTRVRTLLAEMEQKMFTT
jgi:hypothetical protein